MSSARRPFPPCAAHAFELTLKNGSTVQLHGRVIHCEATTAGESVTGIRLTVGSTILEMIHQIEGGTDAGGEQGREDV